MKHVIKLFSLLFAMLLPGHIYSQPATDPGYIGSYPSLYADVKPVCDYQDLMRLKIKDTRILSAEKLDAEDVCLVTAVVNHSPSADEVKVWIALPLTHWNGRFYGRGGGGFQGGSPERILEAARKGFASGATDTGHKGDDGAFALDTVNHRLNWQLIQDFAYLGIHDMTVLGKELVKAFYGKPAVYSYFVGESTGGRQGLMEAQRYPEDYNGILSGCPAINWPSFVPSELWPQVVMNQEKNFVSVQKLQAVTQAVIEACDEDDGTKDGVIEDPINCTWNPSQFVGTKVGNEVFTEKDAEVVRKIWEGPRSVSGKQLWYGLNRGANLTALAGTKGNPLESAPFYVSIEWFRYFLMLNPGLKVSDIDYFTYELLFNQSVEEFASVIGTDNPDLSLFKQRGGKLLILHGLADHLIPTQGSIRYYTRVQERMGGAESTKDFARLYLLPGLDHGFNGNAPKPVRQLDVLIDWVENGVAPESISAELKDKEGNIIRMKSILPY